MLSGLFHPVFGTTRLIYLGGALVFSALVVLLLQFVPQRLRRPTITVITFLGGLFFALEFFWPTHPMPTPQNPKQVGNFLTPLVVPFGNFAPVILAFTVGLGVINLCQVHFRRLTKGAKDSYNSVAFFIAMFAMLSAGILDKAHPNLINKNINKILFDGFYQSLDATMFSIIAFYIVSAAYRAFRVRSVEATMLLVTAVIVMLGQIALGQMLTSWLPSDPHNFWHNFRVEVVRDWIMTKANTPATRAIAFGLGIGNLAVALRIWLGLERGSFFEGQR